MEKRVLFFQLCMESAGGSGEEGEAILFVYAWKRMLRQAERRSAVLNLLGVFQDGGWSWPYSFGDVIEVDLLQSQRWQLLYVMTPVDMIGPRNVPHNSPPGMYRPVSLPRGCSF